MRIFKFESYNSDFNKMVNGIACGNTIEEVKEVVKDLITNPFSLKEVTSAGALLIDDEFIVKNESKQFNDSCPRCGFKDWRESSEYIEANYCLKCGNPLFKQ